MSVAEQDVAAHQRVGPWGPGGGSGGRAGSSGGRVSGDGATQRQSGQEAPRWTGSGQIDPGERAVSVAAGSILTALGLTRVSVPGLLIAGVGSAMIYRGVTGEPLPIEKSLLGDGPLATGKQMLRKATTVDVRTAMLINRPPEQLYAWWRRFENLPQIMTHLESVQTTGDRRSHWKAKLTSLGGKQVEWDAETTRDEPNRVIAWQSVPGAQVHTTGEIRFEKALGDRGTSVVVHMMIKPPGGVLSHWISSIMGDNPKRFIREDLRNFKRLMELGDLPTIIGQPHGTCTGQGKHYTESGWRAYFR